VLAGIKLRPEQESTLSLGFQQYVTKSTPLIKEMQSPVKRMQQLTGAPEAQGTAAQELALPVQQVVQQMLVDEPAAGQGAGAGSGSGSRVGNAGGQEQRPPVQLPLQQQQQQQQQHGWSGHGGLGSAAGSGSGSGNAQGPFGQLFQRQQQQQQQPLKPPPPPQQPRQQQQQQQPPLLLSPHHQLPTQQQQHPFQQQQHLSQQQQQQQQSSKDVSDLVQLAGKCGIHSSSGDIPSIPISADRSSSEAHAAGSSSAGASSSSGSGSQTRPQLWTEPTSTLQTMESSAELEEILGQLLNRVMKLREMHRQVCRLLV
jgi:hypothetical protein